MANGHDAIARRVLGALLLSLAAHAFLIASFKPLSARYAGDPFLRVNLRAATVSLQTPPPGRALRPTSGSDGLREPSAARRVLPEEVRFTKRYFGGKDARPGNLPDGRDAIVELDMPWLTEYYTARQVDQRATPLEEPPLYNPPQGPGSGSTARVVLLVLINESGGVDGVATLEPKHQGTYDAIARSAFGAIRFSPAIKDGKPVKSQKVIEILYGS
jgi:hypothetical protein